MFSKDKSLALDGWTIEFFLHFFDMVGPYLLAMVEDTRIHGEVLFPINSTFIAMISKTNHPTSFSDFQPISLCNLCYKIITKIVARRIRPILYCTLSEEQFGFLKGRQILDAIGITQEFLHNIKEKKLQAVILKLDLKKAYDCTNWDYLRLMLLHCGFGHLMTKWIMGCVALATYAILISGEATQFFNSGRVLRQGCPLSPLLFILVMEGLSLSLKKSHTQGKLTGIKVYRMVRIIHLLFVDDVLIMSKAFITEWEEIHTILYALCGAFGLEITVNKSMFLHFGVQHGFLNNLISLFHFGFMILSARFKYLGFYFNLDSYEVADWQWLLLKYENRI